MMCQCFRWLGLLFILTGPVQAQPAGSPSTPAEPQDPLAVQQQIVRDRMVQLEDRMYRLVQKLAETEPEQAKRLEAALKQSRELLIRRQMDESIRLIETGELTESADRQAEVMRHLEALLTRLMQEDDREQERREEMERLEAYRKRVDELLEKQKELQRRTEPAGLLQQRLAELERALQRVQALQAEQAEIGQHTEASDVQNEPAATLADRQSQARQRAGELADDLTAKPSAAEPEPAGTTRPADRPDTSEAAQAAEQAAAQSLREAQSRMGRAAEQLQSEKPAAARPEQRQAEQALQRATQTLQKEVEALHKALGQQPATPAEQHGLHNDTAQLGEQMAGEPGDSPPAGSGESTPGEPGDGGSGESPSDKPSADSPGGPSPPSGSPSPPSDGEPSTNPPADGDSQPPAEPTPGTEQVQQAGQHMGDAARDLDAQDPQEAARNQQKAIEQLEKAREALEESLDQLRREQQEEMLRGLEARFRAMLARQIALRDTTVAIEQIGEPNWQRADELKLAGLAKDQADLGEQAGQTLHILKEEGTTIVFPRIVEQMGEDMHHAADRLRQRQTGPPTQQVQQDIIDTLNELIAAVEQMREQLAGGQSGAPQAGQSPGSAPLLPTSAELKLLKSCQLRVNAQTRRLDEQRPTVEGDKEPWQSELSRAAERQREVSEMSRKMHERVSGQ